MKLLLTAFIMFCFFMEGASQQYVPSAANIAARQSFSNDRFGLFIHWGPFSIPGSGEWVMNTRNISVSNYKRLQDFFNPTAFDAKALVNMAKLAGMKYITLITRHHDGFSMWDTKYSDFKITNTPYQKDIVKQVADECHRQGIKLFLYYSLLDWTREDYPHETGRTGQKNGRGKQGNYASYLQFMKNQLTELLTNYGDIAGIWFDGHWDQTKVEGAADRASNIDWKYPEIYQLIHSLQPACLIGNNHHLPPFDGEDFQMFEKDLPNENKAGFSYHKASDKLPLETCETMNNSWGFNLTDTAYKSSDQLIQYLVNAAGRNANFLLNIGPMPNGKIQSEFVDTLQEMGKWLKVYGASIYGTRGNVVDPQPWGVVTAKDNELFVHILKHIGSNMDIVVPGINQKIKSANLFPSGKSVPFSQQSAQVTIHMQGVETKGPDTVIRLHY